jgi:hypothetical protein
MFYKTVVICWDIGVLLTGTVSFAIRTRFTMIWTQTFEKHCIEVIMLREYMNLIFMDPCISKQYPKMAKKMQRCRIIYCYLAALHVSSNIFTHHQEHLNCIYSLWYYTRESLPANFMEELEPTWSQF